RPIDAVYVRLIGDEAGAELLCHVSRRFRVLGKELEQTDPFLFVLTGGERPVEHAFFAAIVSALLEPILELPASNLEAPTGQDACDTDDVVLRVAAVDAERVELEQLARVVFVEAAACALGI